VIPKEKDAALAEFRERLDELYAEDVTAARQQPSPVTVQAYHTVFGHYTQGWPL
jgi:hypothetical protein